VNPSTALATVLVDELARGGVRDVVLCPGSRSAPLAFALAAADAEGRLRLHVRIDERSAGFLALGLAKGGSPVAVVTTSGTAVANLHPAVLEASHGHVPLLVLSADRPAELRGSGANQTTEQVGIFGTAPRWSHDLGTADTRTGQVATWRATTCRALAAARGQGGSPAGPAHLNLPLRDPLVPDGESDWVEPLDGRPGDRPWTAVAAGATPTGTVDTATSRTLVLVGDLPAGPWGRRAADLAAAQGWPLVAEPSSGDAWRAALPHGALLLGDAGWLAAHRPDRVLAIGHLTLGRAVSRLLADPQVAVDVVSDGLDWPDPGHRARSVLPLAALPGNAGAATPSDWLDAWTTASHRVAAALAPALDGADWPTGTGVARAVLAALPDEALLFVGASNPVRDVQLAADPGPVTIVANRGLSGIDGSLSTALGLALTSAAPAYALVGDLTFLHDAGGLVHGPSEPRPDLTIVVVNDDGGGIFGLLEPGAPAHAAVFERVFGTPHGVDLGALCAATGTPHQRVMTRAELHDEVADKPDGVRVLEVRVDRTAHRDVHTRLREAARRALG
jgi:2-succinyl-5-enolpyruvyl-6-hydroxy-3-cyclohexene-1-carboxylate synthase